MVDVRKQHPRPLLIRTLAKKSSSFSSKSETGGIVLVVVVECKGSPGQIIPSCSVSAYYPEPVTITIVHRDSAIEFSACRKCLGKGVNPLGTT